VERTLERWEIEEISRGTFNLRVPGCQRKRGVHVVERKGVWWVVKKNVLHKRKSHKKLGLFFFCM
jgi:hypothetical protein